MGEKILQGAEPRKEVFQFGGMAHGEVQGGEGAVEAVQLYERGGLWGVRAKWGIFLEGGEFLDYGEGIGGCAQADIPDDEGGVWGAGEDALWEMMLDEVQGPGFFHGTNAGMEGLAMLAGAQGAGAARDGDEFERFFGHAGG